MKIRPQDSKGDYSRRFHATPPSQSFVGFRTTHGKSGDHPIVAKAFNQRYTSRTDSEYEDVEGVYIISVAARILEMHPQTLRKYERAGLVRPSRTDGSLRLYSEEDIARLRLIKHLVDDLGLNLAGVEFVLDMLNRLYQFRERVTALEEARQLKEMAGKELEAMLAMLITAFDQVAEE